MTSWVVVRYGRQLEPGDNLGGDYASDQVHGLFSIREQAQAFLDDLPAKPCYVGAAALPLYDEDAHAQPGD